MNNIENPFVNPITPEEAAPKKKRASVWDEGMESPDAQEATRRVLEKVIAGFLEDVRSAPSLEEAVRFAPGTGWTPFSNISESAERGAIEFAKESWRPVIEQIRGAVDAQTSRMFLVNKFEQKLELRVKPWDVYDEMSKIRKERGGIRMPIFGFLRISRQRKTCSDFV